jgi:arginine N-succinyltransferase
MIRVREATPADLPDLAVLLRRAQVALPRAAHERLFVAQAIAEDDPAESRLLASVRLLPAIGLELPRYTYHVGCTVHAAPDLKLFHRQRTLLLGNDHTGASELADLACARDDLPLADQAAALRLVVHAALLAVARARPHYAAQLIAEMPGPRDSAGQSPFWQGLGRQFYDGDPAQAAARLGADWRSHVAALLPRHLVYTSFLSAAAQAAVAQVDAAQRVLREVLEEAGLHYGHHVAIDDGGPVLEADVDALPATTTARVWNVAQAASGSGTSAGLPWLAMVEQAGQLMAARVLGAAVGNRLLLDKVQMATLDLQPGASVWALPLQQL